MTDITMDSTRHTTRISVDTRLRYMFSGYKTQMLLRSLRKKAPLYVAAVLGALAVVYGLLHPTDKVKLRHFLTRSCTIETISVNTPHNSSLTHGNLSGSYETSSQILIDGEWIKYGNQYYQLDNGDVYRYSRDELGDWQKELYEIDTGSTRIAKLLDRRNYVRDKKNPFVWRLKEEAYDDSIHMSNVRMKRVLGSIAIVGEDSRNGYTAEVTIRFRSFGTTHIELPWED